VRTRNRRQRQALYAGIADVPLPDANEAIERFERGYVRRPHAATAHLLYDMHRLLGRPARQALPGIAAAAGASRARGAR
jgi:hypothetical protein